jgi:hypothetical protein
MAVVSRGCKKMASGNSTEQEVPQNMDPSFSYPLASAYNTWATHIAASTSNLLATSSAEEPTMSNPSLGLHH